MIGGPVNREAVAVGAWELIVLATIVLVIGVGVIVWRARTSGGWTSRATGRTESAAGRAETAAGRGEVSEPQANDWNAWINRGRVGPPSHPEPELGAQPPQFAVPGDLRYSTAHTWIDSMDGGRVGLTEVLAGQLAAVDAIDWAVDAVDEVAAGDPLLWFTARQRGGGQTIHVTVGAPVAGTVIERNASLAPGSPKSGWNALLRSPYETGWVVLLMSDDEAGFNELLDAGQYRCYVATLLAQPD